MRDRVEGGAQDAIRLRARGASADQVGGGGRYDNLIEEMGGDKAGALGFAIVLERVVTALDAAGKAPEEEWFSTRVFVTHIGPETRGPAFDLPRPEREKRVEGVRQLRADGIAADMDYEGRSLKAQMRSANRVKAPWVVIIGGDEPFDSLRSLTVDWRRGW